MRIRFVLSLSLFLCCAYANGQVDTISSADGVVEKVEIEAQFPGGELAWRKYLEQNLKASTPVDNSAPVGHYMVWARFIVAADGSISDVKALTKIGYGMETEVLRIIRKSGKWQPAFQDGRNVKAYRLQPVTFVVEDASFNISSKIPYTLFTNTNNELVVEAYKTKSEDLQLIVSQGGQVSRIADGTFHVKVNKPGRVIVTIFGKKQKLIGTASFLVLKDGDDPSKPPVVNTGVNN